MHREPSKPDEKAVSPVISTVIITATLLIILVVASFIATNMLEIHMQNSEFEQAKTAMLLLNKVIADVSLRPGAASSVQFNQRSGGIGLYKSENITIEILDSGSNPIKVITAESYIIKYRGGSMVSAAEANLTNPSGLIVDMSKPLGNVCVEVGDGAWIVLDYNRVRVIENRDLGMISVYFISLKPGTFGGSGTVTVRVQNRGERVLYYGAPNSGSAIRVKVGEIYEDREIPSGFIVRVVGAIIEVSIM
ncbi:MAG: hypothetical protein QXG68_00440 [Candidatus Bathyarchaeia archaeon]